MKLRINDILKNEPNSLEGKKGQVYSYSEPSDSFDFYMNQSKQSESIDMGSHQEKETQENVPYEVREIIDFFKKNISQDALIVELGGNKYQRRSGYPNSYFKNYIPVDISLLSIIEYSEKYDRIGIACDAQKLPFKDEVIDVIYTHTFLEHPLNPDRVVKEIHRVLKKGGLIVHSDAWNCRWWQRYGIYKVKKWSELNLREKLLYILIFCTEAKLIRFPRIITKRFIKEIFYTRKKEKDLVFKKLSPNYELNIFSDEDAAASIDPVDLIRFYKQRGYDLVYKKSLIKRIFFNEKNVYLRKV